MIQVIVGIIFLILLVLTLSSVIKGAPFVVSDKKTVGKVLEFAHVKRGQKVADLGSGDGRVVIALAKKGAIVHGYEINPFLVLLSRIYIWKQGLDNNAFIHLRNFWQVDLRNFDTVVVFGISYIMLELEKKFEKELKRGAIVITHTYKLPFWKPIKSDKGVYLYKKR